MSVDCYMTENATARPFYVQSLLVMLLPGFIMLAPLAVLIPLTFYKGAKAMTTSSSAQQQAGVPRQSICSQIRDLYMTSIIVALFLFHPSIVSQAFQMVSCRDLGYFGGDEDVYLDPDMTQQCWTPDHMSWVMGVFLPMLAFWVFGRLK